MVGKLLEEAIPPRVADEKDEGIMLHGYNEIFLDALWREVEKNLRNEGVPEDEIVESAVDRLRIIAQKLARGSERSYPLHK